jgi:methylated-DNA-[protein]-cysteine S-methyltransferase
MKQVPSRRDPGLVKRLRAASGAPPVLAIERSRARLKEWFAGTAPLIHWGEMQSPLGTVFVALTERGLCAVDFGRPQADFLARLDPQARLERDTASVARAIDQLREYFAARRLSFDLPVDLSALTPFQHEVLSTACRITPGQVWTYQRVAEAMGRPKSSRPVGQALAHNPVPIVIPCHRVIASDGSLGGYSGGLGLEAKRWLLRLEGVPS